MAALRNIIKKEIDRKEKRGGPKPLAPAANAEANESQAPATEKITVLQKKIEEIKLTEQPMIKIEPPKEEIKLAERPVPKVEVTPKTSLPQEKKEVSQAPAAKIMSASETQETPFVSLPSLSPPEIANMSQQIMNIALRSQKIIGSFLERKQEMEDKKPSKDPAHLGEAFTDFMEHLCAKPDICLEANTNFWQDYVRLLQNTLQRAQGKEVESVINPEAEDRRFKDKDWQQNWVFDYIKESYLLSSRWAYTLVDNVKDLDPLVHHKVTFYTRQIIDALSPSNFWMMNPEVLRTTIETNGENLIKGMQNMLDDIERGNGQLKIKMSDSSAFTFGENIAATKGKIVFQNDLFQLIQYAPLTETVHKTPLLIVPPWINKYYILDLKPENSMVRYLVEQGHTVFCISWANPTEKHASISFEDYMMLGPVTAATEVSKITGEDKINCAGYCIGGTLLACMMGWLASVGDKKPEGMPEIASTTYLVSLIDFSQPGDLGVFIDEEQIQLLENLMEDKGYLPGSTLATTFSMLRANDLIWSFVVNNYLMGKEPFPFDLLSWNADSTNMPAAMQSYYLRNMYMENNLIKPDVLKMKDVPIDLRKVKVPAFCVSTVEDHITLWRGTYTATQTYSGPVDFCLSGSGHIAGVVNSPAKEKYGYWTNSECPADPEDWLKSAEKHKGSWWPEWIKWLQPHAGEKVPARDPAMNENVIEDAPGSYVRVKGA